MIPLAAIGMGAQAAQGILQTGLGLFQSIRGLTMRNRRPKYNIPSPIQENVALRRANLFAGLPGRTQYTDRINQNQANIVTNMRQGATNSATFLANLGATQGNTNQAFQQLQQQEAIDYQRRLQGMEDANQTLAQYQDKAFQINEMEPFMDRAFTKSALIEGGFQNLFGGLGRVSNTAGQAYQMEAMNTGFMANAFPFLQAKRPQPSVPMNGFYDTYRGF